MTAFIVAVSIVVIVAVCFALRKKETFDIVYSKTEMPVTCPLCNEFGCMGPGTCQPSNTYFTAKSNMEKSRDVSIPAEASMNNLMADYHKMKALQVQMANKQQTVDVLTQQLNSLNATTMFLNGQHAADVKLEQELQARENFSYGGPVIVQPAVMPSGWQLGLSPYISGRD
jgi:hypothetical protein